MSEVPGPELLVDLDLHLRACRPVPRLLLTQLDGEAFLQLADHAETMYRWSGSDHDLTGSNMWSSRTKSLA